MKKKNDPIERFLNSPATQITLAGYEMGNNDSLEWAANWVLNSALSNGNASVIEFAKNMAMSIRASKLHKAAGPNVGDFSIGRDGALLCICGDPRIDHPLDGACNLNGLGHGIPSTEPESKCLAYQANKVAEPLPPSGVAPTGQRGGRKT